MRIAFADVRREGLILVAYLVVAVAATYPLAFDALASVPRAGDLWVHWWNLWWTDRALFHLWTTPFFTPLLFAPYGASLYFHTLNLLPSAMAAPLLPLVGTAGVLNAILFASFMLGGYAQYRLALYLLARHAPPEASPSVLRAAAVVAGATFTFCSYHFAHAMGHLDLASVQLLPLFVLFFVRAQDAGQPRDTGAAALCLLAVALTSLQLVPVLLLWAMLSTALVARSRRVWRPPLLVLLQMLVGFAVVYSPMLIRLFVRRDEGLAGDPVGDSIRFSTDLAAFVTPSPISAFGRALATETSSVFTRAGTNLESVAFVGFVTLGLAVTGFVVHRRATRPWLFVAVVFALLSLGPVLHVMGQPWSRLSTVAPFRLIASVPYGDIIRTPGRFVVITHLALSVIASFGAAALLGRFSGRATVLAAGMVGLAAAENAVVPLSLMQPTIPAYFSSPAAKAIAGTILEVPIPDDPHAYPLRMLYQTVHRRPMFGGHLTRGAPPLDFSAIPGFAQLETLETVLDDVVRYDPAVLPELGRSALSLYDTGDIVVEKPLMAPEAVERAKSIAAALSGGAGAIFEDAEVAAYAVSPLERPSRLGLWLDRGWSYLERAPSPRGRDDRWRWMGDRGTIRIVTPEIGRVQMELTALAFKRIRHLRVTLDGRPSGGCTIEIAGSVCELPLLLSAPGNHLLVFESAEPAESPGRDPRRLSIAAHRLTLHPGSDAATVESPGAGR